MTLTFQKQLQFDISFWFQFSSNFDKAENTMEIQTEDKLNWCGWGRLTIDQPEHPGSEGESTDALVSRLPNCLVQAPLQLLPSVLVTFIIVIMMVTSKRNIIRTIDEDYHKDSCQADGQDYKNLHPNNHVGVALAVLLHHVLHVVRFPEAQGEGEGWWI